MKKMTTLELMDLGRDLRRANIMVLTKHGFSIEEISRVTGISEVIIKAELNSIAS